MDAIDALMNRRSIRTYQEKAVSEEDIETLLRAAMVAPSANNKQPWRFVVIRDRTLLRDVTAFHPFADMAPGAPLAILVCGDKSIESIEGYIAVDCAAATENLLLSAHALGLGAVWCGVYPRQQRIDGCRNLFKLPEHILPVAFIVIGHPAEQKPPAERFDPAQIHHDRW